MAQAMLNQYKGARASGDTSTVCAEDMASAVELMDDAGNPLVDVRRIAQGILVEKPVMNIPFITSVTPEDASLAGSKASPSIYTLPEGSTCVFEAAAGTGYEFVSWSINGEVASQEAIDELTIVAPTDPVATKLEVVALFQVIPAP